MSPFVVLLVLPLVASSIELPKLETDWIPIHPGAPVEKIIGGSQTDISEHPWQASLQYNQIFYWAHICGAVVISNRYILTAAHCVDGQGTNRLRIVVGISNINENTVPFSISRIIMHSGYNGNAAGYPNDIALLELSSTIPLGGNIQAVPLQPSSLNVEGHSCTISGWGHVNWGSVESGSSGAATHLQEATGMVVLTQAECRSIWGSNNVNSGHICVNHDTKSACSGDSGGPLVCRESGGSMVLCGVTSWGLKGCEPTNHPSVYTRITYFADWIYQNSGIA